VDPVDQPPHLPGINKERLPATVPEPVVLLLAGDKPEARRDLRGIEELTGQCDHAVHKISFDDILPDLTFAGLVA